MSSSAQRALLAVAAVVFAVLAAVFSIRGGPTFSIVGYVLCGVVMLIALTRS